MRLKGFRKRYTRYLFKSDSKEPACMDMFAAIEKTMFHAPRCPIYQNVDAKYYTDHPQNFEVSNTYYTLHLNQLC